jgi:aspartate oxidase
MAPRVKKLMVVGHGAAGLAAALWLANRSYYRSSRKMPLSPLAGFNRTA